MLKENERKRPAGKHSAGLLERRQKSMTFPGWFQIPGFSMTVGTLKTLCNDKSKTSRYRHRQDIDFTQSPIFGRPI